MPRHLLEQEARLSESILWSLQKEAYLEFGPSSWTQKGVPFQITSNPYIARQYAEIATSLLSQATGSDPFYILELGGGSGKFAYLFLKELLPRLQKLGLASHSVCYVLTDVSEKNVEFWKKHPLLQPYLEQGILDIAVYDPLLPTPPFLLFKQKQLLPSSQPLLVIANYFFDTITQDLFRVEKGQLFEGRITLHHEGLPDASQQPFEQINQLRATYSYHPVDATLPYYADQPTWNALLDHYLEKLETATFLLPIGALRVIDHLMTYAPSLHLLAGDKGDCTLSQLATCEHPTLNVHGTFSFPVNFHALGTTITNLGGKACYPAPSNPLFAVTFYSTTSSSHVDLDTHSPQECFDALHRFDKEHAAPSLEQLLFHLERSNWDASFFFLFFDKIWLALDRASEEEKGALCRATQPLAAHFFPLTQEEGMLLDKIDSLLQKLGRKEATPRFFTAALSCCQGRVLQISKQPPVSDTFSETFSDTFKATQLFLHTDWKKELHSLGVFDTILFVSPYQGLASTPHTPSLVRTGQLKMQELEKEMPFLKNMAYTDEDLASFFTLLNEETHPAFNPKHLLHFFHGLEKKGHITHQQLQNTWQHLQQQHLITEALLHQFLTEATSPPSTGEDHLEDSLFFEVVQSCLKAHMKAGSILTGYLYNTRSKFEDSCFFEEVIVNPHLTYSEELKEEAKLLVATVNCAF